MSLPAGIEQPLNVPAATPPAVEGGDGRGGGVGASSARYGGSPVAAGIPAVLAIDPGNRESAFVLLDGDRRPIGHGKMRNDELLANLADLRAPLAAIEMVASYGMPVGADVFETCVWIGRFTERLYDLTGVEPLLVPRHPVKLHHCRNAQAKDSNITQALVDRFAPGQPNHGKGTKAKPGWFYGFRADVWQAHALGVYVADTCGAVTA